MLVVDDDAGVRAVLCAALAERGHAVAEAGSAAPALARLDAEGGRPVDALVTDLAMPGGMDGLPLIREAQRRRPGLPAVLVTGHVGDAVHGAFEEAAGTGPFRAAQAGVPRCGGGAGRGAPAGPRRAIRPRRRAGRVTGTGSMRTPDWG